MATANQPPRGNPSRTVGIVVVVILIVVAIAGIVLAGRKGGDAAPTTTGAAPAATGGGSQAAAAAVLAGDPNEVIFAAGSDKLTPTAQASIVRFAEAARSGNNVVHVTARFLTGANKQKDFELSKSRAMAVHHALSADGVPGSRLQLEISEMPAGSLAEKDADRLTLSLH